MKNIINGIYIKEEYKEGNEIYKKNKKYKIYKVEGLISDTSTYRGKFTAKEYKKVRVWMIGCDGYHYYFDIHQGDNSNSKNYETNIYFETKEVIDKLNLRSKENVV